MSFQDFSKKAWNAIFNSNARINIWEGAVRSGKTYGTYFRWILYVKSAPPGDLLLTAKTLDTLKTNIVDPLSQIVGPANARFMQGNRSFYLFGRKHVCRGANDEAAEEKIRGATFAGALGDELTLWPESYWNMMHSRLSVPGAQFFGTTNPDGPSHWLKRNVIDRGDELNRLAAQQGFRPHIKSFHFTIDDNPSLAPDYVSALKTQFTGLWYRRFVLGEWCLAEGVVYDMFDKKAHCVDTDAVRAKANFKHYIVGCDYGTSNPTTFLLIGFNSAKGPFFVVDEYYYDSAKAGRQKTDAQYAVDMKAWLAKNKVRPRAIYVDPSAASFITELKNSGIHVMEADNAVLDGIRFVGSLFANKKLYIDRRNCPNLESELEQYTWDTKAQARGEDKPIKDHDHAPDALRYGLFTAFGNGTRGVIAGASY